MSLINKEDFATSRSSRRVNSEPFERLNVMMAKIKRKPKKVVYPKLLPKGLIKTINIGPEILEERNTYMKRVNRTPVEFSERHITDPDYVNILNPTKDEKSSERTTPISMLNYQKNPVLQMRRFTESNTYKSLATELWDHNSSGKKRDPKYFYIENGNKNSTHKFGVTRTLPQNKKTRDRLIMVGRSLSVPKLVNNQQELSPKKTAEEENLSIDDSKDSVDLSPANENNERKRRPSRNKVVSEFSPIPNSREQKSPLRSKEEKRPVFVKRQVQRVLTEDNFINKSSLKKQGKEEAEEKIQQNELHSKDMFHIDP